MTHQHAGVLRALTAVVIGGILFGSFFVPSARCFADDPVIWKIEEDWELIINEPEDNTNSPQVTFFVTPSSLFGSTYFQLQMNYHADDDYSAGGFHVAAVRGDTIVDEARSQNQALLTVEGDIIRWTSVAAIVNGKMLFAVKDGYCESWGDFGGPEYLVEMPAQSTNDFSDYSYAQSSAATDVGFGGNRVSTIRLRKVRLHDSAGNVTTVTVPDPPQS